MRKRSDPSGWYYLTIMTIIVISFTVAAMLGCGQVETFWPRIGRRWEAPLKWEPVNERPVVNIPMADRQANWIGSRNSGSCTWATAISLLRWQGEYEIADKIKRIYNGGEHPQSYEQKLNRIGVDFAYVTNGDVKFLEWACSTRRGCGITVRGGVHMVSLVHLDGKWAGILDNNNIKKIKWVPRETMIAEWKASRGWAVTPVYSPPAPLPARPIQ